MAVEISPDIKAHHELMFNIIDIYDAWWRHDLTTGDAPTTSER